MLAKAWPDWRWRQTVVVEDVSFAADSVTLVEELELEVDDVVGAGAGVGVGAGVDGAGGVVDGTGAGAASAASHMRFTAARTVPL